MKTHVQKVCLQKKFLTFWDGDKCYFFEISSYTQTLLSLVPRVPWYIANGHDARAADARTHTLA